VTDDTTPQLKAARRDTETKELPEKYRLPSARGELEKENRKLKQKIQKIENRLPKLDLVFQNGKKYWNNTIDPPSSMLTEEEINERLAELREEYPPKDPPSTEDPSGRANTVSQMIKQLQQMPEFTPPESEYRRYNDDREEYLENYREYLHGINQYKRLICRAVSVDVRVLNEGTAPAEDIDVSMHFPDGLQLLAEGDLPEHPEEPTPPEPPQKSALVPQITDSGLHTPNIPTTQLPTSTSAPNVSSPEIEEVSSYRASFHVQRLKHDREVSFDSLYVVYPSIEDAFSFEVDYQIHSASLPEEETGELQHQLPNLV